MSKTLSKILVVCAMIAIFPLMIVGTAFAAYYSIDAKANVYVYVNKDSLAEDSFAQVSYNGKTYKAKQNAEIQGGHLNEITLSASAKGYNFVGWYVGDLQSYAEAHRTDTVEFAAGTDADLAFALSDYENLVAVFEIKSKDVTYKYAADPLNQENLTLTAPEGADYTFDYGDALPTLSYTGDDWTFLGWNVNGGETIYTTANAEVFANETVELSAVWKETEKVTINYYEGDTLVHSEECYINRTHLLQDATVFASTIENGYRYFWKNADGFAMSQINTDRDVNFYLNKEVITYSATKVLDSNEVSYVGSNDLSFTVNDSSKLEALFNVENYKAQYSFWNVAITVKYDDVECASAADLANAIITANPNTYTRAEVSIEATVTKNFEKLAITASSNAVSYLAVNADGNSISEPVYDDTTGNDPLKIASFANEIDTTSTINSLLNLQNMTCYSDVDEDGTREEVGLYRLAVYVGGNYYQIDINGTDTINDMIAKLLAKNGSLTEGNTLSIERITAIFKIAE